MEFTDTWGSLQDFQVLSIGPIGIIDSSQAPTAAGRIGGETSGEATTDEGSNYVGATFMWVEHIYK